MLYHRSELEGWRGHNTNNVCESQCAVIKDFIFDRTRTSSYPHFIRRICIHLQAWYRTTMLDRVFDKTLHGAGSVAKHRRIFFRGLPAYPTTDREACQLINNEVPLYSVRSASRDGLFQTVNLGSGYCTCEFGVSGRVCKHQMLAWQRYTESQSTDE